MNHNKLYQNHKRKSTDATKSHIYTKEKANEPKPSKTHSLLKQRFEGGRLRIHHWWALLPPLKLTEIKRHKLIPIPTFKQNTSLPICNSLNYPTIHVKRVIWVLHNNDHSRHQKRQFGRFRLRSRKINNTQFPNWFRTRFFWGWVLLDELLQPLLTAWEAPSKS